MMRLGRYILIGVLLALMTTPIATQEGRERPATPNDSRSRVDSIIAGMTLEEKVAQMFFVGLYGPTITEDGSDFLRTYQPGGVVIFPYNAGTPEQVTQLTNDWQAQMAAVDAPPLIIAIDQEGGRINTLEDAPFTQFPVPALVTATANYHLAYETGYAQSQELRAVGIHMNLAPVADLETNPDNPVIFRRAYSSDPMMVAPILSAVVQGMQSAQVMATLKHFPGHGDTSTDSHIELPSLPYDRTALERRELIPFRAGIGAGAEAIMVGHLWLPELEPTPNLPASLSPRVIHDLLRDEIGFDGLVMTDALDMDAIDTVYPLPVASVLAIQAGVDVLAIGPHVGPAQVAESMAAVVESAERGEVDMRAIDRSVRRILDAKARYGVLDWQPLDIENASTRVMQAEGNSLIERLFSQGTTVVYGNDSLPLASDEQVLLAYPLHRTIARDQCLGDNVSAVGFSNYPTPSEINELVRQSYNADHIIVFTQNAIDKPTQAQLVNALPPEKTIVVAYWSPYDILAFDRQPLAYLVTYSPLDGAFTASCDILLGRQNAQGRLSVNLDDELPTDLAQISR